MCNQFAIPLIRHSDELRIFLVLVPSFQMCARSKIRKCFSLGLTTAGALLKRVSFALLQLFRLSGDLSETFGGTRWCIGPDFGNFYLSWNFFENNILQCTFVSIRLSPA